MIKSIRLSNLRSFSGTYEVPLGRFNLLFGNNGSGKSTLIESIELAISGTSSRTLGSTISEVVDEVRTSGVREGLSIQLVDDQDRALASFADYGPNLTLPELLETFYGRRAHHKTAQSLLATLFATHNLLTQEKIIKLLDSDSKLNFDRIIKEMIAGHELIEKWEKLERLSYSLDRENEEARRSLEELEDQLNHFQQHLRDWDSVQEGSSALRTDEILRILQEMSLKVMRCTKTADLDEMLNWVQDTRFSINKVQSILGKLRDTIGVTRPLSTIESRNRLSKCSIELAERQKVFEQSAARIHTLNKDYLDAKEQVRLKQVDIQRLDRLTDETKSQLSNIHLIDEWRTELLADLSTKSHERQLSVLQSRLQLYRDAITMSLNLPDIDTLASIKKRMVDARAQLDSLLKSRDNLTKDLEEQTASLVKLQEEYNLWNQSQDNLLGHFEHLNDHAKEMLSTSHLSMCPLCGTEFHDHRKLAEAILENIRQIRQRQKANYPNKFRAIPKLNQEVEESRNTLSLYSKKIDEAKKVFASCEAQIESWMDTARPLMNKLKTLQLPGAEVLSEDDYDSFMKYMGSVDLKKNERDLTRQVEEVNSILSGIWAGLRKQEYEKRKLEIREIIENFGDLKLIVQDEDLWKSYVQSIGQKVKKIVEGRERIAKNLDKLTSKVNRYQTKIDIEQGRLQEHKEAVDKLVRDKEQLSNVVNVLDELQDCFTIHVTTFDVDSLIKKLELASSLTKILQESLIILMQSHKNRREYENNIKRDMAMIEKSKQRTLIIQKLKTAIHSITPLENKLRNEWEKYRSYVNSFFLKLQTPPDFREIMLHRGTLDFDLLVISNFSGETKPANVLSSGQRTALAISIFWTMNLYGSCIPPLMIMDEPIQQIDDLNSLNFLDTLRWIVNSGERQIIVSTASSRIAGLIRRKFSYLGENYNEVFLERHVNLPPVIKLFDHSGTPLKERHSA